MCLTCCDCGVTIQRLGRRGPMPKRCIECRRKKSCEYSRRWAASNKSKVRARNKGPRHAQCIDCLQPIERAGKRGPLAKRCVACCVSHEAARNESKKTKHRHTCQHCGVTFCNGRKQQACCSDACRAEWAKLQQRRKHHAGSCHPCGNPDCKNNRKHGTKYCSPQCRKIVQYPPMHVCQNPACGREFRPKHHHKNVWKGKGKYCTPECYQDHRWGADRPRLKRSLAARRSAGDHALARSLRKRCKQFGVTFDPACTREAVLARDNYVCQKCHIKCNNEYRLHPKTRTPHLRNAEHDHIVPLSVPGSPGNVFENSQCLCRRCNAQKRDTPDGQLRLCLEEEAWGSGVRVRRQRSSKSLEATPAAAL